MIRAAVLSVVALALQAAIGLGFCWLGIAAYREPRRIDEDLELPLTQAGLVVGGPLALAFAVWASARWLHRARPWIALPAVLVLCLPAIAIGVAVTYVLACVGSWC